MRLLSRWSPRWTVDAQLIFLGHHWDKQVHTCSHTRVWAHQKTQSQHPGVLWTQSEKYWSISRNPDNGKNRFHPNVQSIYSGCRLRETKKFKVNKQTNREEEWANRLFDKTKKKITAHLKLLFKSWKSQNLDRTWVPLPKALSVFFYLLISATFIWI